MSWRHPTDEEMVLLQRALSRVPEKHRWEIKDISIHTEDSGYHFFQEKDFWWVRDVEKDFMSEDYWCPTANVKTMCPGPCPDGTEHQKLC